MFIGIKFGLKGVSSKMIRSDPIFPLLLGLVLLDLPLVLLGPQLGALLPQVLDLVLVLYNS